jgi:alkylation response protein AidB-like acyl-CoA dehydrogenase
MLVEGARCLVSSAAAGLDDDDPTEAAVRAGIAAAYAAEAAVECGERCLQIHGGIGFTWEHVTHLLLRKAKSDAVRFGRPWEHWERVTDRLAALAAANGTAGH